jgi:hypothetical protein
VGSVILIECENGIVVKITTDLPSWRHDGLTALVVNRNIVVYDEDKQNFFTEEITVSYDPLYVSDNIPDNLF